MKLNSILKTGIGFSLAILFLSFSLNAQTPTPDWVRNFGAGTAGNVTYGNYSAVDANNDVYLAGDFIGPSVVFGAYTLFNTNNSTFDCYLVKLDSAGNVLWAESFGGTKDDHAWAVCVDNSGNAFVGGDFKSPTITLGATTYNNTNVDTADAYVAKFNPLGSIVWSDHYRGTGTEAISTMSSDDNGNVYLGGNTSSVDLTVNSNSNVLSGVATPVLQTDAFIVKYNLSGNVVWNKRYGGRGYDFIYGIDVASNGSVAISGDCNSDTMRFDSQTIIRTNPTNQMFVARIAINGVASWVRTFSGSLNYAWRTRLDNSNNIYVVGIYQGPLTLSSGATLSSPGTGKNSFLAKFTQSGSLTWVSQIGTTSNSDIQTYTLDIDPAGNVWTAGEISMSTGSDVITFPGLAPHTNVYSSINYIAGFSPAGNPSWFIPGDDNSAIYSISIDSRGNGYALGERIQNDDFVWGTNILPTTLARQAFCGKLKCGLNLVTSATPLVCSGALTSITASGANTYLWNTGSTNATLSVSPTSTTTYTLTGTNLYGCSKTINHTLNVLTPVTPEICMITVDSAGLNNEIYWDKTLYPAADTFLVYRDTANNAYGVIGRVPYASLSMFVDTLRSLYAANGDPSASSWKYKISYIDTCGNETTKSPFHQTLFMINSTGNFQWSEYKIEGQSLPVPSLNNYLFKRDNFANGSWATIQTLSASSTVYVDAAYATYVNTADWRVETSWSIACDPTLRPGTPGDNTQTTVVKSKSNIKNDRLIGLKTATSLTTDIKVYPNPACGIVNVEFLLVGNEKATLSIENMLGQTVQSVQTDKTKNTFDVSSFPAGMYLVKIKTAKGSGVTKFQVE